MNIVYHSSDSFVPVLGVSMVSIMENNRDTDCITFYIIENKWTDEHKNTVKDMVAGYGNAKVVYIPMPDINKQFGLGLKQIKSIWLFDSYSRLFLGTLLPKSVDRVLYLDCDTLCHASLTELYNTDFEGNLCAGVADCLGEKYYKLFGMSDTSSYCNSGMVLFDVDAWRKEGMEDAVAKYVRDNNGYVFFMEQSVMNIVLQDRIKLLHPKYNTYSLMISFSYENLYRLRMSERFYTKNEVREAIANPVIIHLTNSFYVKGRPWIEGNLHPFKHLYMHYRELTPWKEEVLFADKTPLWKKCMNKTIRILPQTFVCRAVGLVYNKWRPAHIEKEAEKKKAK